MSSLLIELHFLPSIEYFCVLSAVDKIVLEKHEHFNKQSFRNRCHILTTHGSDRVTVPLTAKHGKVLITDVQIDSTSRWANNFWRTLESAYAKAPFFEHYADDLRKEILFGHKYLYDLNLRLLSLCLQWLQWPKSISETVAYEKEIVGMADMRNLISAKIDYPLRELYSPQPYQQVFGNNFVPNLSLIDLVFCEGPRAAHRVNTSRGGKLNK